MVIPGTAYPTCRAGALVALCSVRERTRAGLVGANNVGNDLAEFPFRTQQAKCWASSTCARLSSGPAIAVSSWQSDECYIELGWTGEAQISILHRICGPSHDGLLAILALKRSNLAGYRFSGFMTGDAAVIAH